MRIGSFEVLNELGRGGMGVVDRARSPSGEEVALKLLLRLDEDRLARFGRERRLLGSFNEREGFVPMLESGASPQGPYLVMPLVTGGTLRDKLRRGRLAIEETIALGRDLAAAVAIAHERGIVHRDLKPENVIFHEGRPLVADLGLAKHFRADAPYASRSVALTRTGEVRGTLGYLAPEQVNDSKSVGPGADVFALGAILYECLAGSPALTGSTLLELMTNLSTGTRAPLAGARPEAPAWLVTVVERALATEVGGRFRDGRELRDALGPTTTAPSRRTRIVLLLAAPAIAALAALSIWSSSGVTPASAGTGDAVTAPDRGTKSPHEEALALPTLAARIERLRGLPAPDDVALRRRVAATWLEEAALLDRELKVRARTTDRYLYEALEKNESTKELRDLRAATEGVIRAFGEYCAIGPAPDLMADEVAFTLNVIALLTRNASYVVFRGPNWEEGMTKAFERCPAHPTLLFVHAHEAARISDPLPPRTVEQVHQAREILDKTRRRQQTRVLAYDFAVDILHLRETPKGDLGALLRHAAYRDERNATVKVALERLEIRTQPLPMELFDAPAFFGWERK